MHFYTHLLHLLQPSVLWLSIVTFMMQSHRQSEFWANLMCHESDRRLEGSLHLSCKRDQINMTDYMDRRVIPTKWAITIPTCPPPLPPHRPLKRPLKIAFTPLFHLVQFAKCWESSFFEVKFQRPLSKFRKRNKNRCLRSGTP